MQNLREFTIITRFTLTCENYDIYVEYEIDGNCEIYENYEIYDNEIHANLRNLPNIHDFRE